MWFPDTAVLWFKVVIMTSVHMNNHICEMLGETLKKSPVRESWLSNKKKKAEWHHHLLELQIVFASETFFEQ